MTMNPNSRKLFSRSTAAGLGLLLVLAGPSSATAKIKADWSKVQAVALGTRTTVVLYEDQAPRGKRKIEGHFRSAGAEAVTLLLPDGQTRTLRKQAVRKVLTPRPFSKRYQGWITLGVAFGVLQTLLSMSARVDNVSTSTMVGSHAVLTLPATVIAFLVAPKMGDIYNVPLKRRDPSSTKTAPSQQGSSMTVPEVTETGGGPTGSGSAGRFLTEGTGPDRLRWQARQALVRKGLPLDLSGLPAPRQAEPPLRRQTLPK